MFIINKNGTFMDKKAKLLDILTTILGQEVNETASNENLEVWDSLSHIEIIVTVEEEFGIKIPQEKISEVTNFKNLLATIESLC